MAERKPWTRRDQVLVLELYSRTPFGKMHKTNPDVLELAAFLERSPSSIAMKLANFASLDENLDRKGLDGASQADREIWKEFFADPETFLKQARSIRGAGGEWDEPDDPEPLNFREGEEVMRLVKTRRNQSIFRSMVLSSYDATCAITGISNPDLLVASHIVPWRTDAKLRLDPRNGICLNPLHDKAFDAGLISLTDDLSVIRSPRLQVPNSMMSQFEGLRAKAPSKFRPLPEYLQHHRDVIFRSK
jgi:putative restriction endonuclease